MKLYGSKRSLPRSSSRGSSLSVGRRHAAVNRAAMPAAVCSCCWHAGASPCVVTVGTVGTGPKAWCKVSAGCRGRLKCCRCPGFGPDGQSCPTCIASSLAVAVGHSLQSRSAEAATRLETRTKESNMYASQRVV